MGDEPLKQEDMEQLYAMCPIREGYPCRKACAWYDHSVKGCCIHSILGELVKLNERE